MDRELVYPFQQPAETDLLNTQKNAYLGLAQLAQAVVGTGPALVGLACTPGTGLTVSVAPGQIYATETVDATAYSSLAADSRTVVKQGISWTATVLNCPAPGTAGQSINYLVEVGFSEADTNPVILPFYDASNPAVPYSGPNNSGVPSNTVRSDECVLQIKAGTAATTGTQTTPATDAGFVGIFVVTVANGAASITTGNIAQVVGAPFIQNTVSNFTTVAGNPNGILGGTAGAAGSLFPSVAWDMTHNILWVCTTSGAAGAAVWTAAGSNGGQAPYWCNTSTGTANAQTIAPPAGMLSMATGTAVSFKAGFTNTAALTMTVTGFGTFNVEKDSPTGPVALTGGEVVAGNMLTARYDGTNLQLTATELGTASLANASSATGTVAAVSGAIAVGHIAVFSDTVGTVQDSGQSLVTVGQTVTLTVANNNNTLQPGSYAIDTTGGAFSVNLALTVGGFYTFIDVENNWAVANFTVSGNGNNIGNNSTNVASTFIADVSDYQFSIEGASAYWRLV